MKITNSGKNNGMYGKHHSEETKRKISEKAKLRFKKMMLQEIEDVAAKVFRF